MAHANEYRLHISISCAYLNAPQPQLSTFFLFIKIYKHIRFRICQKNGSSQWSMCVFVQLKACRFLKKKRILIQENVAFWTSIEWAQMSYDLFKCDYSLLFNLVFNSGARFTIFVNFSWFRLAFLTTNYFVYFFVNFYRFSFCTCDENNLNRLKFVCIILNYGRIQSSWNIDTVSSYIQYDVIVAIDSNEFVVVSTV